MSYLSLLLLAVALAMDAFAVAIVTGLALNPLTRGHVFRLAFHFGLFQALMPVLGWLGGIAVRGYIEAFDHWIAMGLLGFVGGKMIWESLHGSEHDDIQSNRDPTRGWSLVMLSVATSIDALAVGLTLAMLGTAIVVPAIVIGMVAAAFTAFGMLLGTRIGAAWGKRVEVMGGVILIAIGVKIVVEHLHG